jgi:hypothetical protein
LGTRKSARRKAMKVKEKDKNIKAGKKSKTAMDVEGFKPK